MKHYWRVHWRGLYQDFNTWKEAVAEKQRLEIEFEAAGLTGRWWIEDIWS
jgi:hypothetical protein